MTSAHTSSIISFLQFHDRPLDALLKVFEQPEVESSLDPNVILDTPPSSVYQFGVLDISVPEKDMIPYIWDVKFDIDVSGSMSDSCKDGRSKMQHIKHVITNVLRLFVSYTNITFNVSIDTFDEILHPLLDFIQINSDNIDECISKVNSIYPNGSTNLLLPIENTKKQMTNRKHNFPSHKQLHFLLTDGEDTCCNSSKTIQNAVNPDYDTIVFGFGIDHDSHTLTSIGNRPYCQYAFIAEMEKAGIVYGEYIHNVLYQCISNVTILLQNAEIYCWKTNTWVTSIILGNMACGLSKSYYIRTIQDRSCVTGEISGILCTLDDIDSEYIKLDDIDVIPDLLDEHGIVDPLDISEHILRYKTLEILFDVSQLHSKIYDETATRNLSIPRSLCNGFVFKESSYITDVSLLKTKLNNLYKIISTYKESIHSNDAYPLLDSLLDDLYIAHRSFDVKNGHIYAATRQRTQGSQNVYTPSNIDDLNNPYNTKNTIFANAAYKLNINLPNTQIDSYDIDTPMTPRFRNNTTNSYYGHNISCDTDILSHNISCYTQDNNATPRMLDIIRSTSDECNLPEDIQ
jgi:hypothetical protein